MLKTRKMTGTTWLLGGLVGIAVYFAVILVMIMVASVLVLKGSISLGSAGITLLLFMVLASYLGCLLAGLLSENNKLFGCIAVLVVSLIFRMILTLFTYAGQIGGTLVYTIPELLGFALALLTIAKKGSKGRTKKIKKRYL